MKLREEIIEEIRNNRKVKQALQALYEGNKGAMISDSRFNDWLRHNDERLTEWDALLVIGSWLRKNLFEILEGTPEELKQSREMIKISSGVAA
jgi:hypothetical protein